MTIVLNGEPCELEPGSTVASLVERLGLAGAPCAVEVNHAVVPKREHGNRPLAEGDRVEVVTLVGGG